MAYRCRVVCSERSRPEIFCWVFAGRDPRRQRRDDLPLRNNQRVTGSI
jgi:hypothetical protein